MNELCKATKRNGDACTLQATGQNGFCWAHSPENAEARKRVASRGGRGKAAKKVSILWDELRAVISKVEAGDITPPVANSMFRGFNTLIDLARLEVSQGELEVRQRRLGLDEQERLEIMPRLRLLEDQSETGY